MKKSIIFIFLCAAVPALTGCAGFDGQRQETRCIATRMLAADGSVKVIETCSGTSVQRGYPTFEGSGVNQKW